MTRSALGRDIWDPSAQDPQTKRDPLVRINKAHRRRLVKMLLDRLVVPLERSGVCPVLALRQVRM